MPRIVHIAEHDYVETFRAASVASMFDVPVSEKLTKKWDLNIPIEDRSWQIGLIIGASGSGKTTISKKLFENNFHQGFSWTATTILDDFPKECSVKEITEVLSKVGFSSPPAWLLPFHKLSNGQKFRVELARCLLEYKDIFVFDEFTSVVDRQVAQIGAFAFQKALRASNRQFVAVTCHNDVEEWLQPDWVLDISTGDFKWGCLRRPDITLEIRKVDNSLWQIFKEHHYLTAKLNKSAACYAGFIKNRPVVFSAWLPFFGKLSGNKKGKRIHRTVCLPDYQGLGLGYALSSLLSQMYSGLNYRVFRGTGHPAQIKKIIDNPNWKINGFGRTGGDKGRHAAYRASNRLICRAEFVGTPMSPGDAKMLIGAI